jgi:hypothetical protein
MLKSPITLKSGTKVSATSEVSMATMLTLLTEKHYKSVGTQ